MSTIDIPLQVRLAEACAKQYRELAKASPGQTLTGKTMTGKSLRQDLRYRKEAAERADMWSARAAIWRAKL